MMLRACTLNLYVVTNALVMGNKLRIPGKPELVTLVSKVGGNVGCFVIPL